MGTMKVTNSLLEVLCCHATAMRDGALERPSSRTWQRDAASAQTP
jgi:hypothetical protein